MRILPSSLSSFAFVHCPVSTLQECVYVLTGDSGELGLVFILQIRRIPSLHYSHSAHLYSAELLFQQVPSSFGDCTKGPARTCRKLCPNRNTPPQNRNVPRHIPRAFATQSLFIKRTKAYTAYLSMLAVGSDVLKPPTSYLRKPRKCVKRHLWQPSTLAGGRCCHNAKASRQTEASSGRAHYNRLIGEMIQNENQMQCDDLPNLDELGYSDEFFRRLSALKKKY